jgi:hypothetical protein
MMEESTNRVLRQVVAKLDVLADEERINPELFHSHQSFAYHSLQDVVDSLATLCDYYMEDDYEEMREQFRDNLTDAEEELMKLSKRLNGIAIKATKDDEDYSDIQELENARDYLQELSEPNFIDSQEADAPEALPVAAVAVALGLQSI